MKDQTCCFTGHREISERECVRVKKNLKKILLELIEKDVIFYGAGGARGFDTIAAEAVLDLKKKYPQVKLILVLPCPEQTKGWSEDEVDRYNEILSKADKIVYTADHYYRGCMHVRNRHLVDFSSYCICYQTKETGGTAYTVNYAKEKGLTIYNLAE